LKKLAPLVTAVAEYCLVCAQVEACWACVFSDYYEDVVLELERRWGGAVVSMVEAKERYFRSVASRSGGFPLHFLLN
jgi:hypothetical protein